MYSQIQIESFHSHVEHSNQYLKVQQHQIILLCKPYEIKSNAQDMNGMTWFDWSVQNGKVTYLRKISL